MSLLLLLLLLIRTKVHRPSWNPWRDLVVSLHFLKHQKALKRIRFLLITSVCPKFLTTPWINIVTVQFVDRSADDQ